MKLFVIIALFAAMFAAGSAWAATGDPSVPPGPGVPPGSVDPVSAITAYGLTPSVSGGTITVEGSVTKPASDVLRLGDITGLTIDWKADLTVTGGSNPAGVTGMINFSGNGTFKLTAGKIDIRSADGWVWVICTPSGQPTVILDGGTITSNRTQTSGVEIGESIGERTSRGTLIVNSGALNIPNGYVGFVTNLTINNPNIINGPVGEVDNNDNVKLYIYGNATTVTDSDLFYESYEPGHYKQHVYIARSGATWNIEGVSSDMTKDPDGKTITVESGAKVNFKNTNFTFKGKFDVAQNGELNIGVAAGDKSRLTHLGGTATNNGTINIFGTLTNKDKVVNGPSGKIINHSNTIDNQGTLTNKGTIENTATGKMTNTGTIDNTDGTIKNDGTFQSAQTASEMGGTVDGEVQPIDSSGGGSGNSSGGGCNAGYGIAGLLLLAGLAARKRRA
jgi:hypothetical protein